MAIFTTTDRDNVKAALITAATEGVASVAISGQSVTTYSLDQLRKILAMILEDLAASSNTAMGMRIRKTKPPSCG